jgi:HrpA-like RNA helicase
MEEEDTDLPVVAFKSTILDALRTHGLVICVGETGSGKTTQLPQYLLDSGLLGDRGVCAITQPRRVAAQTVSAN